MRELARWMNTNYMNFSIAAGFHELGTGAGMVSGNAIGNLPVRNWSDGQFDDAAMIQADALRDSYRVAMEACPACQIRCKKVVELENDTYKVDRRNGGPEYETLAAFGSLLGINDLAAICRANELCSPLFAGHDFSRRHHRLRHGVLREGDSDAAQIRGA